MIIVRPCSPWLAVATLCIAAPALAQQGSGEPVTVFASGVSGNIAVGPTGDVFVIQHESRIARVTPSGEVSTFLDMPGRLSGSIAIDRSGNLLVPGDSVDSYPEFHTVIWQITPAGERSVFYQSGSTWTAHRGIAIGPDGDVWVSNTWDILRLDSQGVLKATFVGLPPDEENCGYIEHMAFSPAGELHYTADKCDYTVFKLENGLARHATQGLFGLEGLAFDRDGYLYLASYQFERVLVRLLNPQYGVVADSFARLPGNANSLGVSLTFLRDAAGHTTARLVASSTDNIFELNPAGIRAPGWPVGAAEPPPAPPPGPPPAPPAAPPPAGQPSTADVARALLGAAGAALSPAIERFLDQQGNNNGVLDIGDLRAYLRAQGTLP